MNDEIRREFESYLLADGLQANTIRNYCSWIKRAEDRLGSVFDLTLIYSENEIERILNQLRSRPQYNLQLLDNTKVALRRLSKFFSQFDETSEDLENISNSNKPKTEIEMLIKARLGQGVFRNRVIKFWNGKCAVTGCTEVAAMTASHIKPWKDSTDEERLDGENGLLLIPNLDKLFDRGFISFSVDGRIIISKSLSKETQQLLSINDEMRISKSSKKLKEFLSKHRVKYKF